MSSLAIFNKWQGGLQVSKAYTTKQLIFIYFIIYFLLIQGIPTEITILICREPCWRKNQTISNLPSKHTTGNGCSLGNTHALSSPHLRLELSWKQVQEADLMDKSQSKPLSGLHVCLRIWLLWNVCDLLPRHKFLKSRLYTQEPCCHSTIVNADSLHTLTRAHAHRAN